MAKVTIDGEDATAEHGLLGVVRAYAAARGETLDIHVLSGGEYFFTFARSERQAYRCYVTDGGLVIERLNNLGAEKAARLMLETAAEYMRQGMFIGRKAAMSENAKGGTDGT